MTGLMVLVAALFVSSPAAAKYASFVMEADSGRVLHSTNADTRNYPASLTKLMTLYILFERLEQNKLNLSSRFTVTHRASRQPASKLWLKPKDTLTVDQVIRALVVKSANDVASTVADNISGSEKAFARLMTSTAHRIGMRRTNFRNSSGLPHRAQMSTARDMATLARRIMVDFPQFYHYFRLKRFTYLGKTYRTHNNLLKSYDGMDGMKTGYIRASGFNLVTSAVRGNKRLIGVVFGGRTSKARDKHMASLLDKSFDRLGIGKRQVAKAQPKSRAKSRTKRAPSIKTRSQWGIQVGAYAKHEPARKVAAKAVKKAPSLLSKGRITVVPLRKRSGKVLYRARIVGLDKRTAYAACRTLKRGKMDCMELKVKTGVQVAEAP
ncbi:Putative D-alanyl-D-alanine carboxypeptidase. Putative beta-lactamase-type transpeptidase fold [Magnetospira sp. QH-2]|nr:Putative D-alanyl-D-alanine carboxypeptidase. Putative beta-lactamase-type transpeptidase fold [Magnetospira sp. QH-2]